MNSKILSKFVFIAVVFLIALTAFSSSNINTLHFISSTVKETLQGNCLYKPYKSSCYINEARLKQKLAEGLPPWAKAQIATDLAKFEKISLSEITNTHKTPHFNMLYHFKIKKGKVSSTQKEGLETLLSYKFMVDMFGYLAKKGYIQDTEFLVGLGDYVNAKGKTNIPIFVFAKDEANPHENDFVLMPDWMNMQAAYDLQPKIRQANQNHPWEKKKNTLFWRGGAASDSTGFRQEVVGLSKAFPETIDAQFVDKSTGGFVSPEDHLNYKYLISIDGVRCTWVRLVWHLLSNSLVLKHETAQKQWFYNGIKPYVHYLPVEDKAHLFKQLAWAEAHPKEVQTIIEDSTAFVEQNLTLEDLYHYQVVLLQQYTKLLVSHSSK